MARTTHRNPRFEHEDGTVSVTRSGSQTPHGRDRRSKAKLSRFASPAGREIVARGRQAVRTEVERYRQPPQPVRRSVMDSVAGWLDDMGTAYTWDDGRIYVEGTPESPDGELSFADSLFDNNAHTVAANFGFPEEQMLVMFYCGQPAACMSATPEALRQSLVNMRTMGGQAQGRGRPMLPGGYAERGRLPRR